MSHFGLVCPPGSSHVTGFTAIARELCQRGHTATAFNTLDIEDLVRREGIRFWPLGIKTHPKGHFKEFSDKLSQVNGLSALRFGLKYALNEIEMLLQEAPAAMRAAGVTALLIDQVQLAGSTLAEHLGVPFVTICNAVPSDPDTIAPPHVTNWLPSSSYMSQIRNRMAYRLFDWVATPMRKKINGTRKQWNLKPLHSLYETYSPILELSQQTIDFDFPRRYRPSQLSYVGLIHRVGSSNVAFPFERLDGRPLIYGSLGTVRSDTQGVFRMLSEACAALNLQLVITLGGTGDLAHYTDFPGAPIVVAYAPQISILHRSAVTVCHAGNNTVLESLSCGVPVIAVPLNSDQYGVAARLTYSGAGERISLERLSTASFRELLGRILSDPSYQERARALSTSIERAGGVVRAADLIEQKLGKANA